MPNIATATHQTYARFTVAGVAHGVGTDEAYRGGVQHEAALADDAPLSEEWIEHAARGNQLTLHVLSRTDLGEAILDEAFDPLLDEAGDVLFDEFGPYAALSLGAVDGLAVTVESVTAVTYDDGTGAEFARTQTLTCVGRERQAGVIALTLVDLEDARLNTLYPPRLFNTTDFPGLLASDAGKAIPRPLGTTLKMPTVLAAPGPPYRFVLCDNDSPFTLLTVYRGKSASDARVVDPAEYTYSASGTPFYHQYIEFTAEQRDFDGSLFQIYADMGGFTINGWIGLREALASAGITLDAASIAAASVQGATLTMDCDFGRDGQRTVRAIAEDLLWVLRGTLLRRADGGYGAVFDTASASVATLDEDAGDEFQVLGITEPAKLQSVGIVYRPSPRDPLPLQQTLTRAVAGGVLAAERHRELRYVRNHTVADRCLSYRAARAVLSARLRARAYRRSLSLGDVITVTSAAFGVHASLWRVRDLKHIVGGLEIEATPYDDSLTTYTAGTLPADAVNDYQPDYSNTPPPAPTGFRITATATALQSDGTIVARVTADAIPPTVNWESLWIAAIHNATSEITLGRADSVGGGRYGLTLTGLRPGEVYQLKAYAVNAFGVQGVVQGTFDATAIGGGGTATTFTTAGYATVPADVASITAAQGSGKLINVTWPAVTTANLREYVLERRTGAGAYAEVWRGQARSYVDRDVSYSASQTYRIKARDTYGNVSANYATSSDITPTTGTIAGGSSGNDIASATVATANRTNVSTVSVSTGSSGGTTLFQNDTVAHGLAVVPIATVSGSTGVNSVSSVGAMDSTDVTITTFILDSKSEDNSAAGDPHHHMLTDNQGLPLSFTVYVDVW